MRQLLTGFSLVVWILLLPGCGSEVARTTGVISGSAEWTGTWPDTGILMLALFVNPPWDPDFQPGPPAAFRLLDQPDTSTLAFEIDKPQVAFGTYRALIIAWQDPEDPDAATRDHPVSVYGTTLDALDQATPIVLSQEQPDAISLPMPSFVLYQTAGEMLSHYPSVQR